MRHVRVIRVVSKCLFVIDSEFCLRFSSLTNMKDSFTHSADNQIDYIRVGII